MKIQGRGYLKYFFKIPSKSWKNCQRGSPLPISGFILFLSIIVLKFAGGLNIYTPPPPHPTCASMSTRLNNNINRFTGETPKRRGVITKAGVGKFILVSKGAVNEEWHYCFTDCGLVMVR
jgi:hypothetical protein